MSAGQDPVGALGGNLGKIERHLTNCPRFWRNRRINH